MLGYLGGQPISYPYTELSFFFTCIYFSYVPFLAFITARAMGPVSGFSYKK